MKTSRHIQVNRLGQWVPHGNSYQHSALLPLPLPVQSITVVVVSFIFL